MDITILNWIAGLAGVTFGVGLSLFLGGRPMPVRHRLGLVLSAGSLAVMALVFTAPAGPETSPPVAATEPPPPAGNPAPRADPPAISPRPASDPWTPAPETEKAIPPLDPIHFTCPAESVARRMIGANLVKLTGEPCGFSNWELDRDAGTLVTITCPVGAKAELGVGAGYGVTAVCEGEQRRVGSFTIRFPAAYPSWDAIQDNCSWWANADGYAQWKSGGTYRLYPEGFSCSVAAGR